MNRRGDTEIVINTRILERTVWLILVLALVAVLWWRWDMGSAASDATLQERVAVLETELAERDARISSLEQAKSASLPAAAPIPSAPAPPVNATPSPVSPTTPAAATTATGGYAIRWTQSGTYPATGKYKLERVTIVTESSKTESSVLSYAVCWSSIECERAISRGNFTVTAGTSEFIVPLTIPTYVDVSKAQRLRLTVFDAKTSVELFREELTVR